MFDVILQAGGLIICGIFWQIFTPQGIETVTMRHSLSAFVYVLLLPALVLVVLWRASLSLDAVRVATLAAFGVACGMLAARFWYSLHRPRNQALGALLLAAAFPNATYMGLPVLEATFGPWARTIAIQYDLFACTPLVLSVGVMLAANYGGVKERGQPFLALLKVPALWAAAAGVTLNLLAIPLPGVLGNLLDMLAAGVVPLMLFSIGLSLRWAGSWRRHLPLVLPVVVIQLLIMPVVIWGMSGAMGMAGDVRTAVVLEAAMPSMVFGIVLCDRFRLDTALYAMTVTMSTALSLVTLPLWFDFLG